jgi:arachidonate 15-lipoxygenase
MTYSLPQNDSQQDQEIRSKQLELSQEIYQYNHEILFDILNLKSSDLRYPVAKKVPLEDSSLTKLTWVRDVVSILLRIQSNQAMYDVAIRGDSVIKLVWYVRLSRILKENSGAVGSIYKGLIWLFQKIMGLFSDRVQSEDIEYDVAQKNVVKIDTRLTSMTQDIQQQASKKKAPHEDISVTPLSRNVQSVGSTKSCINDDPRCVSLKSYQDVFQIIYLPYISAHAQSDRSFAAQRLAGANPLVIEGLAEIPANFPVTNEHYQSVMQDPADSLQRALEEHRLYVTDYKILNDIEPRLAETNVAQKYLYQPIALFAIESGSSPCRTLVPIAIQCGQDSSPDTPIFTPPDLHASDAARWAWQMAKLTVQVADANYHELISHLGRTHLWLEPIAIATPRQLAAKHPLFVLLTPHLEGTLFINNAAFTRLVNPGGAIDKLLPGTLESSLRLSIQSTKRLLYSFNHSFLPLTFEARRVGADTLPNYPYRDDALLIWAAIHDWVSNYLQYFYHSDDDVQKDMELQNWMAELLSDEGGQMVGIGEVVEGEPAAQLRTIEYLVDAVTMIIFTASAQHAAVNFPQSSLMSYMPNMPLAGYREAPQSMTDLSESDYFTLLPSIAQSEEQMNTTYLLGSVYYTRLGDYGDGYFVDSKIEEFAQKFKQDLYETELEIQRRNETRATPYDVLMPSKIPQSINI